MSLYLNASKEFIEHMESEPLTLICTLENAAGIFATIQFLKDMNDSLLVISSVRQVDSECAVLDTDNKYAITCKGGTEHEYSNIKRYTLLINSLSRDDDADWFCQVKNPDTDMVIRSKKLSVIVKNRK